MTLSRGITVAAAMWLVAACSTDRTTPDGIMTAWTNEGLSPNGFEAIDGADLAGGRCKRGEVGGFETTLCEYDSKKAAAAARKKGLTVVGDMTGAALASNRMLLVIADRKSADPSGRTIDQITKIFRGRE